MKAGKRQAPSTDCIELRCQIDTGSDVCLFVTHSADCSVKPHVAFHVNALVRAGFQVILICNIDDPADTERLTEIGKPEGIIVRRNEGFDFGAWADAFRIHPSLWDVPRLLLVNDSIIGPAYGGSELFARLRGVRADLVGLVESYEFARHFQSYFLLLNRNALESETVKDFWRSVTNLRNKTEVIKRYELTFTNLCASSGLRMRAVLQQNILASNFRTCNPMTIDWRKSLRAEIPYVKIELVRSLRTDEGRSELKRLIADPSLGPFIDHYTVRR